MVDNPELLDEICHLKQQNNELIGNKTDMFGHNSEQQLKLIDRNNILEKQLNDLTKEVFSDRSHRALSDRDKNELMHKLQGDQLLKNQMSDLSRENVKLKNQLNANLYLTEN